jgi:hypothetical protein
MLINCAINFYKALTISATFMKNCLKTAMILFYTLTVKIQMTNLFQSLMLEKSFSTKCKAFYYVVLKSCVTPGGRCGLATK